MKLKFIALIFLLLGILLANSSKTEVDDNYCKLVNKLSKEKHNCLNFKNTRFTVFDKGESKYMFFTNDFAKVYGYNGYTNTAVFLDSTFAITKLEIVDSDDTRSFVKRIEKSNYLKQYKSKKKIDNIKYVTRATITSKAIEKSVKQSLEKIVPILKEFK